MSNPHKKNLLARKTVLSTQAFNSTFRSLTGTTRKTLPGSTCPTGPSIMNMSQQQTETGLLTDKARDNYLQEYSIYLLRALQTKIIVEDPVQEEKMERSIVSLKQEYEELVNENVELYKKVKECEIYNESIGELSSALAVTEKLLKVIRQSELDEALQKLDNNLESTMNRLHLVGLKEKDLDDAFSQKLIGFDSDTFKLLKEIAEYVAERDALVPETAALLKEVTLLNEENERLRKRCSGLARKIRSQNIIANYKKYFKMAVDECGNHLRDVNIDFHVNGDSSTTCQTLDFGIPSSSSTPSN